MLIEFHADALINAIKTLQSNATHAQRHAEQEAIGQVHFDDTVRTKLVGNLDTLAEQFRNAGMPFSAKGLLRAKEEIEQPRCTFALASRVLEECIARMEDDAGLSTFWYMDAESADWFNTDPVAYFGERVHDKLQQARFDMQEAILCFAFDRYSASMVHLTKVTEFALRRFATKTLGASALVGTNFRPANWNTLSGQIGRHVRSMPTTTAKDLKKKDAMLEALNRFDTVRLIRNRASHADKDQFTAKEAKDYLKSLPIFLQQVIDVI